jgi:hypothetical protein
MTRKERNAKYSRSEKGRAAHAKAQAKYKRTEKGRATEAKYARTEKGRVSKAKNAANLRSEVFALLGLTCAYAHLGGCEGSLEIDHICPPKRRRTTGYTSHGASLDCWIVAHPREATLKLQPLATSTTVLNPTSRTTKLNASGSPSTRRCKRQPPRDSI